MAQANLFAEYPEQIRPDRVQKLREKILKDIPKKVTDDEIRHFREYAGFTTYLPPLRNFPAEFSQLFTDTLIDEDMRDDLQQHDVINWCRSTKKLYPIKTPGDGNCLLHAVSKYVFGLDDSTLFLRRLLYVTLASDTQGRFRKRWLLNQRDLTAQQQADVRLDTEAYTIEWESILKATEDCTQGGSNPLPYCTLESVHLYLLSNIFRRPVIVLADTIARNVFGQSLQDSHIGGIYLPLEWSSSQCHKQPIVIGYNMNHFAPLLMEEGILNDGRQQAIPIVTKQLVSLLVKYMLPEEEANCTRLLEEYLNITEIQHDGLTISSVQIIHNTLPEKYNVIENYRKDCEKRFRQMMDQEVGIQHEETEVVQIPVEPFQFKKQGNRGNEYLVIGNNFLPSGAINIVGNATVTVKPQSKKVNFPSAKADPKECLTMGCKMYGIPEMNYMCSKCFKDFTVQYNRQEEQARQQKKRQRETEYRQKPQAKHTGAVRAARAPGYQYHDLSMMGEDCKCGFKCSTETYPYCHECYPGSDKAKKTNNLPPPQPNSPEPANVELSIMPDKCYVIDCTYNCSKATFPYCHQCFERFGSVNTEVPTAPPQSIPMEVDPVDQQINEKLQLRIQSQDSRKAETQTVGMKMDHTQTPIRQMIAPVDLPLTEPFGIRQASGELSKICKTVGCHGVAMKGNDGLCDNCYNISLFGAGNNASSPPDPGVLDRIRNLHKQCATPSCTEEVTTPSIQQCLECFLKGTALAPGISTEHSNTNMTLNISTPETKEEEKIINSHSQERSSSFPIRSMQISGPPLTGSGSLGLHEPQPMPGTTSGGYRKYLCSTPGCEGIRNENGYCYSCTKDGCMAPLEEEHLQRSLMGTPVTNPTAEGEDMSQVEISCTPIVLTEKEKKELNPLITSSRQKVRCASPLCQEMIYPPKKLCEKCRNVLEAHQASETLKENKQSVQGVAVPCLSPGCQFFGTAQTANYCSSCYKSGAFRHTAPINSKKNPEAPVKHGTAPLTVRQKPAAKLCIEPGCTRFGDPAQADRCSQHYQEAMSRYQPGITPQSIERFQKGPGYETTVKPNKPANYNVTGQRPKAVCIDQVSKEAEQGAQINQYNVAMSRVEGSRKSSNLCKNNVTTGCPNYGNSKNKGYCNTCYPDILKGSQRILDLGQNEFG